MLKNILEVSSNKTWFLADRHEAQLQSFPLSLALLRLSTVKPDHLIIIQTEPTILDSTSWKGAFGDNVKIDHLDIWQQSYTSLVSNSKPPEVDELKNIFNSVEEKILSRSSSSCIVLHSVTSLVFRHSIPRIAKFLTALTNLSHVNNVFITCHLDCHNHEARIANQLSLLQEAIADVSVVVDTSAFANESDTKFSNCLVRVTSRGGRKSVVSRISLHVDNKFHLSEVAAPKKTASGIATSEENPSQQEDPDSLIQTTFRLGLKNSEKKAKSEVVLPYWKEEQLNTGSSANIEYVPDEADDWDEEDPDDDLNI